MCGIFGYVGTKQDGAEKVLQGLKQLEYRGYDSWGVAVANGSKLLIEKHVGKIGDSKLSTTAVPASLAIGHTRWATHGGATERNAHPHSDPAGKIAVVHNGIIENYQPLKADLISKGYEFISETDSEVFVYLVIDKLKTMEFTEAVQQSFLELRGLNAFAVMSIADQEVITVRKGSPLALGKAEDGYYVASDSSVLALYANEVFFLEDNQLSTMKKNELKVYEVHSMQQQKVSWKKLEVSAEDLSKGDYPHFLIKEVHEQPRVLSVIADQLGSSIESYAKNFTKEPIFVGCGTAFNASLSGAYFMSLIAKTRAQAFPGSEFKYLRDVLNRDNFVSLISQSGETIDIVEHLPELKRREISFGAIVNRFGSALERGATEKVLLPAGTEQCVLATKTYTAMVAVLFLLAHAKAGSLEVGQRKLRNAVKQLKKVLEPEYMDERIVPLAAKLIKNEHIFVIGRGNSYPVALEAALKIKEVTNIHTEGFAGGELKHGVLALITQGTPCIVFAPDDEEREALISSAIELKSRGGWIIGIGAENNSAFDVFLPVENDSELSAITHAIVIQLLAYQMAIQLGNDPDKPRNLAKSVTVK